MNKKVLLLLLFLGLATFAGAQNDTPSYTQPVIPVIPGFQLNSANVSGATSQYLSGKISTYQAYDFNYQALYNHMLSNPHVLDIELVNGASQTFLSLQRRDMRAEDFVQAETNANGVTQTVFARDTLSDSSYVVNTFSGFADHDKSLISRLAIYPDNLKGYIWNTVTGHVLYYTSLQDFIQESGGTYQTAENFLLVFDLGALTADAGNICTNLSGATQPGTPQPLGYFEECTTKYLEIACEGDKKWCDVYGGVLRAKMKILETLFLVEGIYTYNFNISFVIKYMNFYPFTPNIYSNTDIDQRLNDFRTNWVTHNGAIKRDCALLFSGHSSLPGTAGGVAWPYSVCDPNSAYATINNVSKKVLTTAHELGHILGSHHDNGPGGYGSSSCTGMDVPIMCATAYAAGPDFKFSTYTRGVILDFINAHGACLGGYDSGMPVSLIHKSWSNAQDVGRVGPWRLGNGDYKVVGNFDGQNGDEEIFFASADNNWVSLVDFSCDQGTNWYHLWSNYGSRTFGTWHRNTNDKYLSGDFDGNGKSDLFSVSGNCSWAAAQEYNPGTASWIHKWGNSGTRLMAGWYFNGNDTYVTGDFDGDGKDELLCINPNGWAQIIRFNWSGSAYTPQTIWSNNGNGWVGGVQINNTNRWHKGKFATLSKDELFTISGTWVTTQRFDGTNWQWIWSQYGASDFAGMYILPITAQQISMTGNFDGDANHEFINLNNQWCGTAEYSGSTYVQNWNNGGNFKINDWDLTGVNEYFLVKAAPTAEKQIFAIKYRRRTFYGPSEPYLCGMYKGNAAAQDFKPALPIDEMQKTEKIKVYPNPARDKVIVELGDVRKGASIAITDMSGRLIKRVPVNGANTEIALSDLPGGMYLLTATLEGANVFTTKIVVAGK